MKKIDLKGLSKAELERFIQAIGEKKFRAQQLWIWMYVRDLHQFKSMTNISKALQNKLERVATISRLELADRQISKITGTQKFLWSLEDGLSVESVFIPDNDRRTICISTQVGCALGCHICATGRMGLERNLYAHEMVDQVAAVQRETGEKASNIVVMGMGEPFQNYDELIKALYIVNDCDGIAIGHRKITISTAGMVPELRRYTEERHPFRLAISLHATTNEQRNRLMPINRKYPIEELMKAVRVYARQAKSRPTFEYVLIDGINDSQEDARRLLAMLRGFPCKVNLITYNSTGSEFKSSTTKKIEAFSRIISSLLSAPVTFRLSKGDDIAGACGQLAGKPGKG